MVSKLRVRQLPKLDNSGGVELWSLAFAGETMEAVETRAPGEFVQSPVRQMADRSVLYKYLNPSLLLIATSAPEDETDAGKIPPVVTIYLIDSVIGRLVSRTISVT